MNFLSLSFVEFLVLALPMAAGVVALYLYDRSRRRQLVSTLRFFPRLVQAPVYVRRKKIEQPWSLLLQLLSLLLLLLAIAEPRFGPLAARSRDHVLILETSAWMNSAAPDRRGSLMELARRRALEYLRAVPGEDRLLLRADGLPMPATRFTADRRELQQAIQGSRAGATALDLPAALELARSQQRLGSSRPGEIAFIGSGRLSAVLEERVASAAGDSNLRAILLGGEPNDAGIRRLSARRSLADPLEWQVDAGLHNYGTAARRVTLRLTFAGSPAGARTLSLPPHGAAEASFRLRSAQPGRLEATLDTRDDYRADNSAALELPAFQPLRVQLFSAQPERWRPLLASSRHLDPQFLEPGAYSPAGPPGRLVILDGFSPASPPDAAALWIRPPADPSPARVLVQRWNDSHPIAQGLRNKDVRLTRAAILAPEPGATAVAETEAGAVLAASASGPHKKIVFGFHPADEGTDSHLAIPLLFANLVRWISPELFRPVEMRAASPGLIEIETPPGLSASQVQISSREMQSLPFTLLGNRLRFFAGQAGAVQVTLPERQLLYSLNLPEIGESRWTPPPGARRGVPAPGAASPLGRNLWPWLAAAGLLGLLGEWALYGRRPVAASSALPAALSPNPLISSSPHPVEEQVVP